MTLIDKLTDALRAIVSDIEEYERINNLSPAPGKSDCWQSVTNARAALAEAERVKGETSDTVAELRAWGPLVSSGYECPAAGTTMHRAADTIERLERELADWRDRYEAERQAAMAAEAHYDRMLSER